ncbi:anti-sigma factor [Gordonia sp. PKS22-38]|uniref:Anti-sigma factor n=1 Tax=Gordonia prachuapensis TaxID=3115651 RepID=A0ABU7MZI4_9ACTN|nr:anti-sigma factor [Gordonia sp. PKS22-38]
MGDSGGITDEQEVIDAVAEAAGAPVKLSVIAHADRLPIVRSVVERTLLIDDWTIDDVADVKLGVDEICSQMIAASEPDRCVDVSLAVGPRGMTAQIEGWLDNGFELDTSGFGWRVVETVTDAQSVAYVPGGSNRQVVVRFVKRRATH